VPEALRAYEAQRRPRVMRVAEASRRTGHAYHLTGLPAHARNAALRLGGAALVLGMNDWVYRWRPSR
jgi:salicylate hydroxylase